MMKRYEVVLELGDLVLWISRAENFFTASPILGIQEAQGECHGYEAESQIEELERWCVSTAW